MACAALADSIPAPVEETQEPLWRRRSEELPAEQVVEPNPMQHSAFADAEEPDLTPLIDALPRILDFIREKGFHTSLLQPASSGRRARRSDKRAAQKHDNAVHNQRQSRSEDH